MCRHSSLSQETYDKCHQSLLYYLGKIRKKLEALYTQFRISNHGMTYWKFLQELNERKIIRSVPKKHVVSDTLIPLMNIVINRLQSVPLEIARAEIGESSLFANVTNPALSYRRSCTVLGEQSLTYCLEKIFEFIAIGEEVWRHEESGHRKSLLTPQNVDKLKNETVAEQKARELLCAADIDESMYWQLIESDRVRFMFEEDKRGRSSSRCVRSANCCVFFFVFENMSFSRSFAHLRPQYLLLPGETFRMPLCSAAWQPHHG